LYLFVALLLVSWTLVGIGGYLGNELYHEYLQVRADNARLLLKERELAAVRLAIERIQKEEEIIRNFLGLEGSRAERDILGQGGVPSPQYSTVAPGEAGTEGKIVFQTKPKAVSILRRAQRLETNLDELIKTMRDRRQLWDSTPSILPVETTDYWLSSGFGWRKSPFTGLKEFHNGLDISSSKGTPVVAPADGIVSKRGYNKYLGKYLDINHGGEIVTTYGHLLEYSVSRGQRVKRGDVIAFVGNTGLSTGHHLHYMIKVKDKCVNPLHYILNLKANGILGRPIRAEGGAQ
jgi:murein DD-endopeptidase MepM/ murein hydrolase activator NlpD